MASSDNQRTVAQKTWELSNNILEISPGEEIYKYDKQQQQQMLAAKPWEKDPHFFKDIKVRSGNWNQIRSNSAINFDLMVIPYKNLLGLFFNGIGICTSPFENGYARSIWWQS